MNTGKSSLPSSSCCGGDAGGGCHIDRWWVVENRRREAQVTPKWWFRISEIFHKNALIIQVQELLRKICTGFVGDGTNKLYEQKQDFGDATSFCWTVLTIRLSFRSELESVPHSGHREKHTFQTSIDFRAKTTAADGGRHLLGFSGFSSGIWGVLYWAFFFWEPKWASQ